MIFCWHISESRYGPLQSYNRTGSGKDKYHNYNNNNNNHNERASQLNYSHNYNSNGHNYDGNNNYNANNNNRNKNSFYGNSRIHNNASDEVLRTPTRQTKYRQDAMQPGLQMSSTIREAGAHAGGSFPNQWNKNHPQQHSVGPYGLKESSYKRPSKWQLFSTIYKLFFITCSYCVCICVVFGIIISINNSWLVFLSTSNKTFSWLLLVHSLKVGFSAAFKVHRATAHKLKGN